MWRQGSPAPPAAPLTAQCPATRDNRLFDFATISLTMAATRCANSRGEHMKIAWKAVAAFSSLVLVSCGGGGGNAAISKSFNYGAPQAPSSTELAAASSAKSSVTASSSFGSSPD